MKLLTVMFQNYMTIAYENFTAKFIAAKSLLTLIDNCDKNRKAEIEYIEENTDCDVNVSLYKLDRNINPTKGEFKACNNKVRFVRNGDFDNDDKYITLTEDQMQYHLCKCIAKVDFIVLEQMKKYKEEIAYSDDDDDDENGESMQDINALIGVRNVTKSVKTVDKRRKRSS